MQLGRYLRMITKFLLASCSWTGSTSMSYSSTQKQFRCEICIINVTKSGETKVMTFNTFTSFVLIQFDCPHDAYFFGHDPRLFPFVKMLWCFCIYLYNMYAYVCLPTRRQVDKKNCRQSTKKSVLISLLAWKHINIWSIKTLTKENMKR